MSAGAAHPNPSPSRLVELEGDSAKLAPRSANRERGTAVDGAEEEEEVEGEAEPPPRRRDTDVVVATAVGTDSISASIWSNSREEEDVGKKSCSGACRSPKEWSGERAEGGEGQVEGEEGDSVR